VARASARGRFLSVEDDEWIDGSRGSALAGQPERSSDPSLQGSSRTNADRAHPQSAASRRVLIVEDDVDVGNALEAVATQHGWQVIRSRSCAETRGLVGREGFSIDVAVVDLQLPDGWGLDLVRALHAPPLLCAGLVVLTGMRPSASLASDAYASGAACVLWKPTRSRELLRALDRALARSLELRSVAVADAAAVTPRAERRVLGPAADAFLLEADEVLIVRHLCVERTDRAIAESLGISESAVKRALTGIRAKMGVDTRVGIVRKVYEVMLSRAHEHGEDGDATV
jgi:two-component system, NarL family, response regulator DevR